MKIMSPYPQAVNRVVRPHHSICVVSWQYPKRDNLASGVSCI